MKHGFRQLITDPLPWLFAVLLALIFGMTSLGGVFHWMFPELSRPVYQQESFASLVQAHLLLVGVSSLIAVVIGVAAGVGVTRPAGKEFRSLVETLVAMGQTFPPVAVLAVAVPVMGFSEKPAIIALVLYGLLPILQGTIAGIESVSPSAREIAQGVGMSRWQMLRHIILPQAFRLVIPPMTNDFIAMFKDSSIVSVITMVELTKMYGMLAMSTYDYIGLGVMTAGIYFALSYPASLGAHWLERRLRYDRR